MYQTKLGDYDVLLKRITLKDSPNHVYKIVELGKMVTSIEKSTTLSQEDLKDANLSAIDEYGYVKVNSKKITKQDHN